MQHRPQAVALDVIGTLFAIAPLEEKLRAAGLPPGSLRIWFPRVLRDGFALEISGEFQNFQTVALGALDSLLEEQGIASDREKSEAVIEAFATLPVHPDVPEGLRRLREAGLSVAALTNGSKETTEKMFRHAGLSASIDRAISIDEVKHWKPHVAVYRYAAGQLGLEPAQFAMIAAHDWDVDGASKAGLVTGYLARKQPFPSPAMRRPDVSGSTLGEVVAGLLALPE